MQLTFTLTRLVKTSFKIPVCCFVLLKSDKIIKTDETVKGVKTVKVVEIVIINKTCLRS